MNGRRTVVAIVGAAASLAGAMSAAAFVTASGIDAASVAVRVVGHARSPGRRSPLPKRSRPGGHGRCRGPAHGSSRSGRGRSRWATRATRACTSCSCSRTARSATWIPLTGSHLDHRVGFHAAVRDVAGDTAVIETPTCPLRPLVSERLEAALLDRGMWAGLIERGSAGAEAGEIRCETASCLEAGESCHVTVRLLATQQA